MTKSFPNHKASRLALISISLALSQTPVYTARPWGYGVPVSTPAFVNIQYYYSQKDGQAELACVASYMTYLPIHTTDSHLDLTLNDFILCKQCIAATSCHKHN